VCYLLQTSQTSGHNISKRTSSCKVRTRTFLRRDAMHAALFSRFFCPSLSWPVWTRSQSVAKLADRTASQHLSGFCDVIGNLTIWFPVGHFLLVVLYPLGSKPLYLTVSGIFIVKCQVMVDMTLIRPLNKGQGHSFWCQSICYRRLPIYRLSIVSFALGRTVYPQYIPYRQMTTDRRNTVA